MASVPPDVDSVAPAGASALEMVSKSFAATIRIRD
jgi:hypothetical protein